MNVVPLIDIMLVLLTIVLVTSTFIATGKIPVDLPKAKTSQTMKNSTQEFIEIDSKENIYFHEKIVSLEQLDKDLKLLASVASQTQIVLRADKKVTLNVFVTVMDMLKEKGFENLNLQAGVNIKNHVR